jgi:hypothetical protein
MARRTQTGSYADSSLSSDFGSSRACAFTHSVDYQATRTS